MPRVSEWDEEKARTPSFTDITAHLPTEQALSRAELLGDEAKKPEGPRTPTEAPKGKKASSSQERATAAKNAERRRISFEDLGEQQTEEALSRAEFDRKAPVISHTVVQHTPTKGVVAPPERPRAGHSKTHPAQKKPRGLVAIWKRFFR
jgi:hypothetical protein